MGQHQRSDQNSLDLIQANGIIGAIIELRRARRLVICDLLRVLDYTTVLQISGDPGGSESVAAGRLGQSGLSGAPFDHRQHLQPM
jgi:hypothetical protein